MSDERTAVVRPAVAADAAGIAHVHVESWRTTYRGIVPDAYLDALSIEERTARWQRVLSADRPGYGVFVAEHGGAVVGFADGGRSDSRVASFTGELYAIYLLAGRQRRGTGERLLRAVAAHLAGAGHDGMMLWVLAENAPARRFYERLGGVVVGEQTITIGGAELAELAYGWPDLARWLAGR
jgi:ribosomal protein S18 acetylase RimI-like enzyme